MLAEVPKYLRKPRHGSLSQYCPVVLKNDAQISERRSVRSDKSE